MFKRFVLPLAVVATFFISVLVPALPPLVRAYVRLSAYDAVHRLNIVVDGTVRGHGTGFFVKDATGQVKVLTNFHVCTPDVPNSYTRLDDGRQLVREKWDYKHDLCLLHVVGSADLESPVDLAPSATVPGDDLYVIGHPWAGTKQITVGKQDNEVTIPIESHPADSVPQTKRDACTFTIDPMSNEQYCVIWRVTNRLNLDIRPGNSGSPILNSKGELVGVVWGHYPADHRGLGVPFQAVRAILGY